jgi:hypothetical protein
MLAEDRVLVAVNIDTQPSFILWLLLLESATA